MAAALVDLIATLTATAIVLVLPGAMLLAALRGWQLMPPLLRPAATVTATLLLAGVVLILTMALHGSRMHLIGGLAATTCALGLVAAIRRRSGDASAHERPSHVQRLRDALPFAAPSLVLVALGIFDAPQVRSDTFWHVALARKIAELDQLSSAALAFEAGARGNANYPLPVYHALLAVADAAPRVDVWSATWFVTLWLAPVAMLAFAGMAGELLGERRAQLVGAWTFVAVVVLGYGPWFFATRYLSYAGQVGILLVLPLVVVAGTRAATAPRGRARAAQLGVAAAGTICIGVLHGNYVLYPALFAGGMAALLLLGRRDAWRAALATTGVVLAAGVLVLGAQLPWITNDDNFLRGTSDPAGEPTAFTRHRDVFVGTEQSHHIELGSLATQPLLVLGALALPLLLLVRRRRTGPWMLAGGAFAIVVFARSPDAIDLIDRLGSVTPATRLDRVYPAALGVAAAALGAGWLLQRAWARDARLGRAAVAGSFVIVAAAAWWLDSIRDTRRIVVTPFVEARWVGGLDPSGVPRIAVVAATLLTVAVAIWIRVRVRERAIEPARDDAGDVAAVRMHRIAAGLVIAIVVGLAPASVARAAKTWQPEAYVRAKRSDAAYSRIEVYPPAARRAAANLPTGAVVLAGFNDVRRIASLAPVQSVEESILRELVDDPPTATTAPEVLDALVADWTPDFIAANRYDRSFAPLLDAAAADPCRFELVADGYLRIYRVTRADCT